MPAVPHQTDVILVGTLNSSHQLGTVTAIVKHDIALLITGNYMLHLAWFVRVLLIRDLMPSKLHINNSLLLFAFGDVGVSIITTILVWVVRVLIIIATIIILVVEFLILLFDVYIC